MPHILRDVNPIVATLLTQHHIFYDRAIIIVSSHSNLASQDNERLILRWVPMDGYHSPWLHRIQHPMAFILHRLISPMPDYGRCPQSMQNGAKGCLARLSEGGRSTALNVSYLTTSKKVSGRPGSKISLQYITVTKSSVSERLMMLCV